MVFKRLVTMHVPKLFLLVFSQYPSIMLSQKKLFTVVRKIAQYPLFKKSFELIRVLANGAIVHPIVIKQITDNRREAIAVNVDVTKSGEVTALAEATKKAFSTKTK